MRRAFKFGLVLLPLIGACGKGKGSTAGGPGAAMATGGSGITATTYTYTDARGEIFARKGCPQCHTISALGIKSPAEIGPDLTLAYADVQTRFGLKLDQFLAAPTGTMQVVLSSMIKLTPAERDSIIHILKDLHEEREERSERHDQ